MKKDVTKKLLEDYNDVYADIFNALLFGGETVLEEEYLVPLPTESFTRNRNGSLRQGNRDVRKADKRNGCYRLICGEENQESRENTWLRPRKLYDMLEFPEDIGEKIKPFVADYPMNLIEMARLPEHVRNRLRSDFRLIAEYAACKNKIKKLENLITDRDHVIRHPEEFLDALSAVAGDRRYERIKAQIRERAEKKKEDITMCLIAEALENRGLSRGLSEGRLEGAKEKAEAIARNMFARGISAEDTAAICEESLEQICAWFAQWRKEEQ